MVVLAPHGASGTYGQLSDIGADTKRASRDGFARRSFNREIEVQVGCKNDFL